MNRFWQMLLGIERSSPGVVPGGRARLELAALPKGTGAIAVILGSVLLVVLLWALYRLEKRGLSRAVRCCWSGSGC